VDTVDLPTFCLAKFETTVGMYADYLDEACRKGGGWNPKMANAEKCGIEKAEDGSFKVLPGRANYPICYLSWYNAAAFAEWCGLRLPTEAEMVKATRGGHFLDGDGSKKVPNPLPERKYPWGNEAPDAGGVYRCNFDGAEDGFDNTAPVGSFAKYASPYGACDLAGNVAEWTLDSYTTTFHTGLDGYRILRGGSWLDPPEGCDAVTAPTSLPNKQSAIVGFRGACEARP
jgi:formylglycine-generating enzyme required for sulfatase activity